MPIETKQIIPAAVRQPVRLIETCSSSGTGKQKLATRQGTQFDQNALTVQVATVMFPLSLIVPSAAHAAPLITSDIKYLI